MKEGELQAILRVGTKVAVRFDPVEHKNSTWYKLILIPEGNPEGVLLTKLNDVRVWKSLNKAIQYVERHFIGLKAVTVLTKPKVSNDPTNTT